MHNSHLWHCCPSYRMYKPGDRPLSLLFHNETVSVLRNEIRINFIPGFTACHYIKLSEYRSHVNAKCKWGKVQISNVGFIWCALLTEQPPVSEPLCFESLWKSTTVSYNNTVSATSNHNSLPAGYIHSPMSHTLIWMMHMYISGHTMAGSSFSLNHLKTWVCVCDGRGLENGGIKTLKADADWP